MTVNGKFQITPLPSKPAHPEDAAVLAKIQELRQISPSAASLFVELLAAALDRMRERPRARQ